MMSREDILRELELLPMWQLRNPDVKTEIVEVVQSEAVKQAHFTNEVEMPESASFRLIASEDGQWLFALTQQTEAAETLLHNMLTAVAVKVGRDIAEALATTIADFQPKVIVVMGEELAQQLLALSLPLEQLRGGVYALNEIPVIVTYTPDALLQNPADKVSAWADLCHAKFTIDRL